MSETLKSNPALEDGYQAMANDEDSEAEALEWAEATMGTGKGMVLVQE